MEQPNRLAGMQAIIVLALGQLVSLVGTGMTRFALSLWVWNQTESVTAMAWLVFFIAAPSIVLGPLAGTLVDRWKRKGVLIFADLIAGLTSVVLLILYLTDQVQIWHLYVAGGIASVAESFQTPAQAASVTLMVPKEQHTRANGLISMTQFGSIVISPAVAGLLMAPIGVPGILAVDVATFLFAVGTLVVLLIPQPRGSEEGASRGSVWRDTAAGASYILARPAILHVIYVFTAANFLFGVVRTVFTPMILARTGQDARALGLLLTLMGIGGLVGGLFLGIWKGPKRRIHGVLVGMVGSNLLGAMVVGVGQSFWVWAIGGFFVSFFFPIMNGCVMAIGQAKVTPDIQGRVFGLLRTVAQATYPLALVIAGPLTDHFFRPAMAAEGTLAPVFGNLVGTGDGAGMSLLILLSGLLGILVGASGYLFRTVRDVEDILPDQAEQAQPEDSATGPEGAASG